MTFAQLPMQAVFTTAMGSKVFIKTGTAEAKELKDLNTVRVEANCLVKPKQD